MGGGSEVDAERRRVLQGGLGGGLAALAALLAPGTARASQTPAGAVRLTYFETYPPLSFRAETGAMTGTLIETLDDVLGRRLGVALTHAGYPWGRAQELVRAGEADGFCTLVTPARQLYARFSAQPVLVNAMSVFYATDHPRRAELDRIMTVADLKPFSQVNYIGNGFAETVLKGLEVNWVRGFEQALQMVAARRQDLIVIADYLARYSARRLGLAERLAGHEVQLGADSRFHLGLRADYPGAESLLERFDAAMADAWREGLPERIKARYI